MGENCTNCAVYYTAVTAFWLWLCSTVRLVFLMHVSQYTFTSCTQNGDKTQGAKPRLRLWNRCGESEGSMAMLTLSLFTGENKSISFIANRTYMFQRDGWALMLKHDTCSAVATISAGKHNADAMVLFVKFKLLPCVFFLKFTGVCHKEFDSEA